MTGFLKNPFSRLFALAALLCSVFAPLAELTARLPAVEDAIPYRSLGNYDYQFEIKWFLLQDYVKQNGGVDVILLGNSLVNTGLVPGRFEQTYYENTGSKLRVFNFGVEGLTITPISHIAEILVSTYHPALLIYVTDMRDYVAKNGLATDARFLSDPWIRYRNGDFNGFGWLVDHSVALQDYLPYRNWMSAAFFERMSVYTTRLKNTTLDGYEPDQDVGKGLDQPPNPDDPQDAVYFEILKDYQLAPSRLKDLQNILSLNSDGKTFILVVEMPVHPTFYDYAGGAEVHRKFQETLRYLVKSQEGTFIPAEICSQIPLEGRSNRWHLNELGAPVFSSCLANRLAGLPGHEPDDFISHYGVH